MFTHEKTWALFGRAVQICTKVFPPPAYSQDVSVFRVLLSSFVFKLYVIFTRYLGYSLDSSKIRSQDAVSVINYVASNPVGKYPAWIFVQNNWEALFDM